MKQIKLFAVFMLISLTLAAQPYGQLKLGINKGSFDLQIGYKSTLDVAHKAEIGAGIIPTFAGGTMPKIVYLRAGGELIHLPQDIVIVPSIGISHHFLKDNIKLEGITGMYMFYNVEAQWKVVNNDELVTGWVYTNEINIFSIGFRMYID